MGNSVKRNVRRRNGYRNRRLISDYMIDRRSDSVTAEEGDHRTWELAGRLVRIDSSDPGAYEGQIEQWIYKWFTKEIEEKAGALKSQVELVQREVMSGRFNLMARIPEEEQAPAPTLVYICHMDTVMLGEEWEEETPTLGAMVREGRLYGRGAYDMRSGLACVMPVFSDMVKLTGSTGGLPARPFVFIGTVDEGDFMRGAENAIRDGWVDRGGWILDTEPTDGQIQIARKGRTQFELAIQGTTARASNPWRDADAIAAMAEAVNHIRRAIGSCSPHEDLGTSAVTFGQVTGGYRPYVVSDFCKVQIDMRLVPPMDAAAAKNIIEEAVKAAETEVAGVRGSYLTTGDRPYVGKDSSSRLLASLKSVCDRVTGEDTPIGSFNSYMDTAVIAGTLGNYNCVSYGPGSLELAHKPNEYMPYEDVRRYRRILTELARQKIFFPFAF